MFLAVGLTLTFISACNKDEKDPKGNTDNTTENNTADKSNNTDNTGDQDEVEENDSNVISISVGNSETQITSGDGIEGTQDVEGGITFTVVNKSIWALVDCNVRKTPDSNSSTNKVGKLTKNQEVVCTGISTDWVRIQYNNEVAYVTIKAITDEVPDGVDTNTNNAATQPDPSDPIKYVESKLAITEEFTAVNETVYVISAVNVRNGPGTYYDSLGKFLGGTPLTRVGVNNTWSKISYKGNMVYIRNTYLTTTKPN